MIVNSVKRCFEIMVQSGVLRFKTNASGIEVKLSWAQLRALDKLTDKWQSAYELQERIDTLNILAANFLAASARRTVDIGAGYTNRNTFYRRLK